MIAMGASVKFFSLVTSALAAAQTYAPVVTMSVTLPDGRTQELTAPESGLATVTLKDGTEYGFQPTIQDSMPWNRIVVTIFRMATSNSPTEILGKVELERGGPAADSKTNPSFKVAVPNVSLPATQKSSTKYVRCSGTRDTCELTGSPTGGPNMLRRVVFLACSVALLACVMATPSTAQTLDKRTLFTFSGPVSMPGVTLPAGQYLFRLANPESGRNVVQVLNADGTKPYGMFFAMRAERLDPASTAEVRFMETATSMPAAIKTWWYPGERSGYEFVYPKEQARRLAQSATQPVLTTQTQTTTTEQTNTADLTRFSSAGQETNVSADATPTASTPGGVSQQGEIASSGVSIANATIPARLDASPAATNGQPPQRTRASLPQTASTMPVVTVAGCVALFVGIGLWAWRRAQV
jgi:hypothetical protein